MLSLIPTDRNLDSEMIDYFDLMTELPSSFLKSLNLKTNDIVNIVQEEDKIIISVPKKKKISLKERFEKFNGTYENDFSWDEPVGKEIW